MCADRASLDYAHTPHTPTRPLAYCSTVYTDYTLGAARLSLSRAARRAAARGGHALEPWLSRLSELSGAVRRCQVLSGPLSYDSNGCCQAAVRLLSGCCQAAVRAVRLVPSAWTVRLSDCQTVRLSDCQAAVRLLSGCCQTVRLLPWLSQLQATPHNVSHIVVCVCVCVCVCVIFFTVLTFSQY